MDRYGVSWRRIVLRFGESVRGPLSGVFTKSSSSNPVPLTKHILLLFAANSCSVWNIYTKKGRYTEISRLPMSCCRLLEKSSWQTLGLLRSSPTSSRNEIRLSELLSGWHRRLFSRLDMTSRRIYGLWELRRWSWLMVNLRMHRSIQ